MDKLTPEQRKKNMRSIKGKDTSIEMILRKALWKKGYHYRKNYKNLPGTPDIALTKYKIAIFCDGEFFHGKDWEILKPRLERGKNSDFWVTKISKNRERDEEINKKLLFMGWTVIRFWGMDIKKNTDECIKVIEETIFEVKMSEEIIYVFLTIFLYLLKCPQSLILSALRAFCFCGKPHISRSIFLYFRYQAWLKSW